MCEYNFKNPTRGLFFKEKGQKLKESELILKNFTEEFELAFRVEGKNQWGVTIFFLKIFEKISCI